MRIKFANIISHLFHPLFMPSLGLIFFYYSNKLRYFNSKIEGSVQTINLLLLFSIILFSFLIPAVGVILLKKKGRIQSFQMHNKEERFLPFTITGISLLTGYYLLFDILSIEVEALIKIFYLGCIISVIGALAISLRWKISIHMIGIGGFTGAVFLLSKISNEVFLTYLLVAITLSGLIAFSRLKLNAHSYKQVIAGFILGFFCETFSLFFY